MCEPLAASLCVFLFLFRCCCLVFLVFKNMLHLAEETKVLDFLSCMKFRTSSFFLLYHGIFLSKF